ncbi:MAG: CPBP family glutamic-type intramembrane protease [Acidimicrobiales bacterium]
MTSPIAALSRPPPPAAVTVAVLAAGCVALLARPALLPPGRDPTARLVVLFVVLGVVGAAWPLAHCRSGDVSRPAATLALAVGLVAFTVGRFATGGPAAVHPWFVRAVVLNSLAAVAEEAFFRRLLYGVLERHGQAVAVVGSAAAFAVVHVTVWGLWVLPLDLAAGLLLSWQRAASGRWSVPAATHVFANVLALV